MSKTWTTEIEYTVYFDNHQYYSNERFDTLDKAKEYGKSKGFCFSVGSVRKGDNPYNPAFPGYTNFWGSWNPLYGWRKI